jgi:hypothetical protein
MVWDAIRQYGQALSGRFDDWHPPALDWLWRELLPLHAGPAPMLVLQLLLYWGGFGLCAAAALRLNRKGLALALVACGFLPIPFALMGAVLKDSLMAGALLSATGFFFLAKTGGGRWPRAAAILLLVFAATLRFNAFVAGWPLLIALLPSAWRRTRARFALTAVLAAIPLLVALPLANRLLGAQHSGVELSLIVFDLGGVTEDSGVDVFPPQPVANPVAVNHRCYSPVKWDPYAWWGDAPCPIGFDSLRAAFHATGQNPYRVWIEAIAAHPLAYAQHRLAHFNAETRFFVRGQTDPAAPSQSDPNPWNYRIQPNGVQQGVDHVVSWSAITPLGWPIWWMAMAAGVAILTPVLPSREIVTPIALSALLYGLGYLAFGVASEMRYHLWTMIAALLAVVIAASDLADGSTVPRGRLAWAMAAPVLVALLGVGWRLSP